ncbi:MAG: sensor histidine kinase [Thermoplasmatota archaeon]
MAAAPGEDADGWVFMVRDSGIGIEATDQHRLFVPFQRLHSAAPYAGSGIGLANCRRLLERHHGRIWLESEPGKGASVHFTFPAGGGSA